MAIKDAVRTIVEALVTHPEDVLITLETDEDEKIRINISVNAEDRGRVIGRQGKTINALRTVVKAAAIKSNQRINLKVLDENDGLEAGNNSSDEEIGTYEE
ncbi:MAG: KH domain-containing protein [Candidatus Sericytochromatia bacterium]|nr:KH domain-containing protein [Candidatus Sericytochromatia bacterium]